jgi:hypothetical protein
MVPFKFFVFVVPKSPDFRRNIEKTKATMELCCERLLQRKKLLLARSGMCPQDSKLKKGFSHLSEQEQDKTVKLS